MAVTALTIKSSKKTIKLATERIRYKIDADWSSLEARLVHSQKVGSSNLPSATKPGEEHWERENTIRQETHDTHWTLGIG